MVLVGSSTWEVGTAKENGNAAATKKLRTRANAVICGRVPIARVSCPAFSLSSVAARMVDGKLGGRAVTFCLLACWPSLLAMLAENEQREAAGRFLDRRIRARR